MDKIKIKGINVCNPVDVEKNYLLSAVEYAKEHGINHIQINGPIHDGIKGNVDGMTLYREYACFNNEKNEAYVSCCVDAVNAACEKADAHGIKVYMWHHELELPYSFKELYPETVNACGDIEVTHPKVKDFLENKIRDFFYTYSKMAGIVLTLHETKIPLLKLKAQKLGKIERVKYVTQILYDVCTDLGKEMIVRPFASLAEDNAMMAKAFEEVSPNLLVMDKWTQFDWSLTMPHNKFFLQIQNNPLLVEGDIFGEFFGKGYLPLMLREHLKEKFSYCEQFSPQGYVVRVDRAGNNLFGDINEVNLIITEAYYHQCDIEKEISKFFLEKYPNAAEDVRALMEQTEDILIGTFYLKGYYFTELSLFPSLNHCKNHFYFDILREQCQIGSDEWFIPEKWNRGTIDVLIAEKERAVDAAKNLLYMLEKLEEKIEEQAYLKLWVKFCNLKFVTEIWHLLTLVLRNYTRCFEFEMQQYEELMNESIEKLLQKKNEAIAVLHDDFYCMNSSHVNGNEKNDRITQFVDDLRECFRAEKRITEEIKSEDGVLLDYVICGGAMEGHFLQKEVNFSDTLLRSGKLCRIPGNSKGAEWSTINAHGWFSYLISVHPNEKNYIKISAGAIGDTLDMKVAIGNKSYELHEINDEAKEFVFCFEETNGDSKVRIRFDKLSESIPFVYTIKVYSNNCGSIGLECGRKHIFT